MPVLSRDAILSANDLPKELVSVPEWGGDVWVYALSGIERDGYEASLFVNKGKNIERNMENMRAKLLVKSLRDESGNQLFSESDLAALGGKSAKALDRCFEVAVRLNGLSKADQDELVGNS